jgi:hypothetical protein
MRTRMARAVVLLLFLVIFLPTFGWAQSFTGAISGTVTDPTGAVVPNVSITLTHLETGTTASATSGPDGLYSFQNLRAADYDLKASASGFRDYLQRAVSVGIDQRVRVDIRLELGTAVETVEVTAAASTINYDTAEVSSGIAPSTLKELPLLVAGTIRQAAAFAVLMPGVSTGSGNDPFDARINGGLQTGDEAVMDGVSLQQGMMNQTGMISILTDFPMTPDMVSELKVLTSSYAPEYGSSLSGQIVVESKAGGNEYHAGAYWYHRNTVLNARQFGADERPKDIEHDYGAFVGGPFRLPGGKNIPWFNTGRKRSFFYLNLESFRNAGGVNRPVITVPTMAMRNGDFSAWPYPIYDPASPIVPDPNNPGRVTRTQFMGCDPINNPQPNVICSTDPRLVNSLAKEWMQFIPEPNVPGTQNGTLNNFLVPTPIPDTLLAKTNYLMFRGDLYHGEKDHVSVTVWYQGAGANFNTVLPFEIANETYTAPQFSFVDRIRWDHTFTPTLLNHFGFGYLDRNEGYGSINWLKAPNALPRVPGVLDSDIPPVVEVSGYPTMGQGNGEGALNRTTRQTYVFLDTLTWVKGKHTIKAGFEYRDLGQNIRGISGAGGTFRFTEATTGLPYFTSGNGMASFLLGAVDNATVTARAINARYPRSDYYILHLGDTWKATSKLSINYGLRWDTMTPARELYDHHSFFDPNGANPAAGGLLGRLAFAGTGALDTGLSYGSAAYGARHPEKTWWKGFAPRLGIAYSVNPKTVVRAGYGIFYTQAFYPGWESSIDTSGFTADLTASGTHPLGLLPAFDFADGFPIGNFILPPFIDAGYRNGQDIQYKPIEANRRAYAQQWNLSIEREFAGGTTLSLAYIGNKGTRLPSRVAPLNALNPNLLSTFTEDDFQLSPVNGVFQTSAGDVPVPYAEWEGQLSSCSPSLAQALLPYPQYCSSLQGLNENAGNSTYHSFQARAEKRFAQGLFLLSSYTLAKLIGSSDQTQADAVTWSGAHGVISPFERQRNKALAVDDVPQTFSLALVYELPFGRGKRWANVGGVVNKIIGGWEVSSVFRATSGIPFFFRSGTCNVPGEFRVGCIPAILPGANPFAQSLDNFDPEQPLFNRAAFEPVAADPDNPQPGEFGYFGYYGTGPRISNVRGFGYHNHNIGFIKNTQITEKLRFQIRAEFFNVWNWHIFSSTGRWGDSAFNTDISSSDFGMWNGGTVSQPRNIQVGARLEF